MNNFQLLMAGIKYSQSINSFHGKLQNNKLAIRYLQFLKFRCRLDFIGKLFINHSDIYLLTFYKIQFSLFQFKSCSQNFLSQLINSANSIRFLLSSGCIFANFYVWTKVSNFPTSDNLQYLFVNLLREYSEHMFMIVVT